MKAPTVEVNLKNKMVDLADSEEAEKHIMLKSVTCILKTFRKQVKKNAEHEYRKGFLRGIPN